MKKAAPLIQQQDDLFSQASDKANIKPPLVTGQCAEVLEILRKNEAILSFELQNKYTIPQYCARISNLRSIGFNIATHIQPWIEYRGMVRRNVALYSLNTPEWPSAEYLANLTSTDSEVQP